MSAARTGGPAFPGEEFVSRMGYATQDTRPTPGMTLRDYFATHAMAAVWSKLDPDSVRDISIRQTAKTAYQIADAMLMEKS